jgi:ribosomal protein S18 acetylase RimI-like enzyme
LQADGGQAGKKDTDICFEITAPGLFLLVFSILNSEYYILFFLPPSAFTIFYSMKIIAGWGSLKSKSQAAGYVKLAKSLGFNAFIWIDRKHDRWIPPLCKKAGLVPVKVVEPLRMRPGAVSQKLAVRSPLLPRDHPRHQHGGEPLKGKRDVLDRPLACPNDPGVVKYTLNEVAKAVRMGFRAVCWDFIGYRDLRGCACALCRKRLKKRKARGRIYENLLVSLYDRLYKTVKRRFRDIPILCHIHPVFVPNLWYGLKINVDYCCMTASWFFRPHWTYEKIRRYLKRIVNGPYRYKHTVGMPLLAVDCGLNRHKKTAQRIRRELEMVQKAGAQALMVDELGSISRSNTAMMAIHETNTSIVIRPFNDATDHAEVAALWKSVFGYTAPRNDSDLSIKKKTAVNDGLFFVALHDGRVAGTVMAGYDGHRGWIYSLSVLPELRKKGIGRALMQKAEAALTERGCLKINLQILKGNEVVVDFYSNLGYKVEERVSMGKVVTCAK